MRAQFIYSQSRSPARAPTRFVPDEFDGFFVSERVPDLSTWIRRRIDARWLAQLPADPASRWIELAATSTGLGVRRQRVPVESLLAYEVWLPPLDEQLAMVRAIDRLDRPVRSRTRGGGPSASSRSCLPPLTASSAAHHVATAAHGRRPTTTCPRNRSPTTPRRLGDPMRRGDVRIARLRDSRTDGCERPRTRARPSAGRR